ncbi:hypothetical protein [Marinisporobacter balticus]|uniref:Uncharacterized protein n=1 Tax=Marinisporobacter balticus TaxID=2018667 RepID=A0A4R2K4Y9_9FIRM|nr:hypothetical protein [Marinisporobacter balticus]TCO68273.1 hypothetical protein EV214_14610 [Marinisporobacter balticus]
MYIKPFFKLILPLPYCKSLAFSITILSFYIFMSIILFSRINSYYKFKNQMIQLYLSNGSKRYNSATLNGKEITSDLAIRTLNLAFKNHKQNIFVKTYNWGSMSIGIICKCFWSNKAIPSDLR